MSMRFLGMMNSFQGCDGREPPFRRQETAPGKAGSEAELINRGPRRAPRGGERSNEWSGRSFRHQPEAE